MKPEFTKPFNIEHAKAGAPYCCSGGSEATILKWDCNHQHYPLIGAICENGSHYPESWTASGMQASDEEVERRPWRDLVMLPLGMIDGKPVFVGDEIEAMSVPGDDWIGITVKPGDRPRQNGFRWPAPAKAYPETTMLHKDMFDVYSHELRKRGHNSIQADTHGLAAVANAALRHAIDGCRVIASEDAQKSVQVLQANLAKTEAELNGAVRELMIAGYNYRPQSIGHADRAARDLTVAEAVRSACEHASYTIGGRDALDLAAIIATIK